MRMQLRPAAQRGRMENDWLSARFSFSFANYRDARFMGYGPLRVINQDRIAPGRGFGAHGHRNMEILTVPLSGAIEHRDSMGHSSVLRAGQVQLMQAGSGVQHSEMNPDPNAPTELLQIWIEPDTLGLPPRYSQLDLDPEQALQLVASPTGRGQSLRLQQDVDLHRLTLGAGEALTFHPRGPQRRLWLQLLAGTLQVGSQPLGPGDGLAVEALESVDLRSEAGAQALLFDLP